MSVEETSLIPPLLGDRQGRYRVHIVGNSGAGKSTLGAELAAVLGLPFIPLDRLGWKPSWKAATPEELRAAVQTLLAEHENGWVIDGNYYSVLGDIIDSKATDTIWLDPPLALYFPRLCIRTLRRLLRLDPPCAPGCLESIREVFFSRDSILWYSLTHHMVVRKRELACFRTDGLHVGGTRRRIGGWGGELAAWKQSVRDMVAAALVSGSSVGGVN